jgi:hypothetical protein
MTKIKSPLEYEEQVKLTQYLTALQQIGKVVFFSHLAQSTFTKSFTVQAKNKASGVRKGVPDLIIIIDKQLLFIEMKRLKGGKVEPEQAIWNQKLKEAGQNAFICKGFEEAKKFIETFL